MIRITGGKNRSRLLETPATELTKPTMDKVRSAVFNIINEKVNGSKILDLFAGSGSYGFEALSRGATSATFVDKGYEAIKTIKNNALLLKENNVEIVKSDVIQFLESTSGKYDIVFADPPYKLDIYSKVVKTLLEKKLLNDGAIIVLESENNLDIDETKFKKVSQYKYGLAKIYVLRN